MIPLDQIDAYLHGPALLAALAGLGLAVGVLTGLFGVGGGFLLNPLMLVLLGMDESLVVGSSLSFITGTAAAGIVRHMRGRNVEFRSMVVIGLGAIAGAVAGASLHAYLRAEVGRHFKGVMLALYLVLLVLTAWLVARKDDAAGRRRSLLQRLPLPPRVRLPGAGLEGVSLPGLVLVGVLIGVLTGMLGIGGGVLFMPLLLLVVGLSAHQAVGTSLGMVLFGSITGTVHHGLAGNVSLWVAMALLVAGTVGVQVGAWACERLHARRLRQYFAAVALLAAVVVAIDLAKRLIAS